MTLGDRMWVSMWGNLILSNVVELEFLKWAFGLLAIISLILFVINDRREET